MSWPVRVLTLIIALGLLSFAGLACGVSTDEVRQIAAEQLEVAAKKLAADATPAPQAAEKAGGNSGEIFVPKDFSESPLSNPSQTSTETLEKIKEDSITISNPKEPLGTPQLVSSQDLPESKDQGDTPQAAPSTGAKTTTAKGETSAENTSIGGKQTASDTTLTNSQDPGSPGWPSIEENPQLAIGITYVQIWASVGIEVRTGFGTEQTIRDVRLAVRSFLWPLAPGGPSGEGWVTERPVRSREVAVVVAQVAGVDEVFGVLVGCETGGSTDPISMRPQELPELTSLAVQVGEPQTREEMLAGPIKSAPVKATAQAPAQQPPKPTATPSPGYC